MSRLLHSVRTCALAALALTLTAAVTPALADEGSTAQQAAVAPAVTPTAAKAVPASARVARQPAGTTIFRLASFNMLGAGHTDRANPRKGFAKSPARLRFTRQILDQQKIDVVGFQEMHKSQVAGWKKANGGAWGGYPYLALGEHSGHNTIVWRKNKFRLIKAKSIKIPYFNGKMVRMPYVLLEHRASGQRSWFYNVHNPANVHGDAQKWRNRGFTRAINLVNRLRKENPGIPVFMTGDMNDRAKFFCPTVAGSALAAANGGHATAGTCEPPPQMSVDWVLGTAPNTFTRYLALRDDLVRKTTDHPVIIANVNLPSTRVKRTKTRRVVVVSVEGLRSDTVLSLGKAGGAPALTKLRHDGSSTLNARAALESTLPVPNLVSMVTGWPVSTRRGGHGVTANTGNSTVHAAAGRYVPVIFGLVHNNGKSTAIHSSRSTTDLVRTSWDDVNGGGDPYGPQNGRNKISTYALSKTDAQAVGTFAASSRNPAAYTHIHLGDPRTAGEKFGFTSSQYRAAVQSTDARIGEIRTAIQNSPALNGRTLLIVTSTGGGQGTSSALTTSPASYKVPLLIAGPGVPAAGSLYAMNPRWNNPGNARVGYASKPITTGIVPNIALAALRLPPVPDSNQNALQNFNIYSK